MTTETFHDACMASPYLYQHVELFKVVDKAYDTWVCTYGQEFVDRVGNTVVPVTMDYANDTLLGYARIDYDSATNTVWADLALYKQPGNAHKILYLHPRLVGVSAQAGLPKTHFIAHAINELSFCPTSIDPDVKPVKL